MKTKVRSSLLAAVVALAACCAALVVRSGTARADVLAQWTFEASFGSLADSNVLSIEGISPEVGAGTARGAHEVLTTFSSPAGNGSAHSFSSNHWTLGSLYGFSLSTAGYQDIVIAWDQASSNTGPGEFRLYYGPGDTTTTGTFPYSVLANASPNPTWSTDPNQFHSAFHFSLDLSAITDLNNQTLVHFNFLMDSNTSADGGTVGSTGTDRMDNVTISGTLIPEPATLILLALGGVALIRRRRTG